jgi:hypothetical protein
VQSCQFSWNGLVSTPPIHQQRFKVSITCYFSSYVALAWNPMADTVESLVIMDILGVILAVTVSRAILDGPLGMFLISKLGGA